MNRTTDSKHHRHSGQWSFAEKLREMIRPRRRRHDQLLVLSLATFNSGGGWAQVLSPLKVRETVG